MADFPCQNPSCKSFGIPHPNCKCAPEMAEGGETSYCASDRKHDKGCQYFAEGGEPLDAPDTPLMFDDLKEDAPAPDKPLMFDDLKEDDAADKPLMFDDENFAANPNGAGPYESPGQQLATVAEGAAQGLAGPLAPLAETKILGIPAEDIAGRQEANPIEHALAEAGTFAGSMVAGVGEAGLIAKAGEAVAKGASKLKQAAGLAEMGRRGAAAIRGGIEMGLIHGSDEVSKAILGQAPPEHAVNPYLATGAHVLFGLGLGAAGSVLADKAASMVQEKFLNADLVLAGVGLAEKGEELPKGAPEALASGYKFFRENMTGGSLVQKASKQIAKGLAGTAALPVRAIPVLGRMVANKVEDAAGAAGEAAGKMLLKPLIGKPVDKISKYATPVVLRWLQAPTQGSLYKMIDYANKVDKGTSLINNSVDALFKYGAAHIPGPLESDINRLRDYQEEGGLEGQIQAEKNDQHEEPAFAEGGKVESKKHAIYDTHDHIAQSMPEQNLLIQTAKGRVSNYLSSQRPQKHQPKLAFDDEPDDRQQKKRYDKALAIAAQPVSVLGHIKDGTIEPEHIEHLNAMYPELTQHLQQKLTQRIVTDQMNGKKPSYKVRQGLSMLMGAPLSGELTPQSIQAAQAVFRPAAKQGERGPGSAAGGEKKPSAQSLSKTDRSYLTDDQAREARQQRSS